MKPKRKILSLLLVICLVAGLMPTAVFAAGTDTGKAIQLGTSGIAGYDSAAGYDYIYYGEWDNSPIKWRVLDEQTNTQNEGLFLLSDVLLGTGTDGGVYFDSTSPYGNAWQGSDAQDWCKTFYSDSLTTQEQSAVLETTKSDTAFTSSTYSLPFAASENILNGDKVFFLSAEEAENSAYGFQNDTARIANYGNSAGCWWLRSPGADDSYLAGLVYSDGDVHIYYVTNAWAARPAFNLNLNSVLFTSAAVNGKSADTLGTLSAVPEHTGSDWKLTLLDDSRNSFTADVNGQTSASAGAGCSIEVSYSGAQTGNNEYVSALLCDSNDNVLYYGNIAKDKASGKATLNIPSGLATGSYKLKVFSEQCNGDKMTDYASKFTDILLTIQKEPIPTATFTATDDNGGTLSNVEIGMRYSTDGGANWKNITGTPMEITDVTAENDVKVYKPGDGTTIGDSDIQTIDITQPDEPEVSGVDCTTTAQNNGQITGVNDTMEYRLSTAIDWTGITGTTVTGLLAGTYEVRIKANETTLASPAATVTISEYVAPSTGGGTVISKPTTSRIAADDRFETAVKVADQLKKELGVTKFNSIVVAYSDEFADALSASAFAQENEAPVLVVNENNEEYVRKYIEQNLAKGGKVYIMGGNAVVTERFEDSLSEFNTVRLGGSDRYETNLLTLKQLNLSGKDTIIIASGLDYADALSASSTGLPIMIVGDKLTDSQIAYLKTLGGDDTYYIVGGTAAVSSEVEKQLKDLNLGTVNRLAGDDRYETSALIAETFYGKSTLAYLASGDDYPDGLTGGVLAGLSRDGKGAPLLLVNEHNTNLAASYIEDAGVRTVKAIGGTAVISDETLKAVI